MATSDAPVSISSVTLIVNDLAQVAAFYARVIGLDLLIQSQDDATLGLGERPLIFLRQDSAEQRRPKEAGLFHTAFLVPDRADSVEELLTNDGKIVA